ncbi:MAG: hypothetical protein IJT23_02145 [Clostridia bacterium]|nr:hypothetical protein [Clostridia bacterium]
MELNSLKDGDTPVLYGCVSKLKKVHKFAYVYLAIDDKIVETLYKAEFCSVPFDNLCEGAFIKINATVKNQPRSQYGKDILITDFSVLTKPYTDTPFPVYDKDLRVSLEDCMENKISAIRHMEIKKIYKAVSAIQRAFSDFFEDRGYTFINTPVIVPMENDAFSLSYFNDTASLITSAQPYLTPCTAAFGKVYSISHIFMNKRYNSTRHLNEYITLNAQSGYVNSINDIIDLITDCIAYIITNLDKKKILKDIPLNYKKPQIIEFYDALKILGKENQTDLDPTDIKKLCAHFEDKSDFVIVTHFPASTREFYIEENRDSTLNCFDLYFRGLKIGTGSKNITDYNLAKNKNNNSDNIYTEALKYGIMPFGGFTIGLERFCTKLLDLSNIREASVFPRDVHHTMP